MPTDKQIHASRNNGARSRGPVTPKGKANAAGNRLVHGALAKAIVLDGESRSRFHALVETLNTSLKPETEIDHLLIGKMAAAHWRQLRIWNLEKQGEKGFGDHEMRLDRQFFRTLDRYMRLRALNSFSMDSNPTNL